MLIAKRNAMSGGKARPPWLPADCVEVEYLESTGEELIKTEIKSDEIDGFEIEYLYPSAPASYAYQVVIGNQYIDSFCVGDHSQVAGYGAYIRFDGELCAYRFGTVNSSGFYGRRFKSVAANGILYSERLDDGLKSNLNEFTRLGNHANIGIFGYWDGRRKAAARIYFVKFSRNNSLVLDLVPVRRKTDGLGYMCDKLTGTLYGNAGTGAFIIGPDKPSFTSLGGLR